MAEFNPQAFKDAYSMFTDSGYSKDENSFKELMNTNMNAFDDMYKIFKQGGYTKTKEEFAVLIGATILDGDTEVVPEKKNPDGTPIVPGGPGSEDSMFTPEGGNTELPIDQEEEQPLSDSGEEVIEEDDVVVDEDVEDDSDSTFTFDKANRERTIEGETFDNAGNLISGEKATFLERQLGKNAVTDFFGDMYRAVEVGAAQAGGVDDFTNLALSKTENLTDEEIKDYIEAAERLENQPESDEMRSFRKISAENGGGFAGMFIGLMNNFSIAPAVMLQSLRSMVTKESGGAAAVGAGGGALAGWAAGATVGAALTSWTGPGAAIAGFFGGLLGAGTGAIAGAIGGATTALEASLSFAEFFKERLDEKGLDYSIENVRLILEDKEAMNKITNRALARGFTIGAVEGVSFGLSKGAVTGIAKAGARTAQQGLLKGTIKGKKALQATNIVAGLAGTTVEGVAGSGGEALGRLVAGQEMDEIDIFLEGIAGFGAAPLSVTAGLMSVPKYKINGKPATQEQIDNLIRSVDEGGMTMEELASAGMTIDIINDPARKQIFTNARAYAKLGLELDPNVTDPKDRKSLLDLEYAKTQIKNPDLESSKVTIKRINRFIKAISDRYNGNTNEKAVDELNNEGVENPTPEQIKEKADAIFKRETKTMDAQKLTPGSTTLGKGDQSEQETTDESSQEEQNQDEVATPEKKKVEVTPEEALAVLTEEGNTNPTPEEISNKVIELQAEVDLISEQESTSETEQTQEELKRNETKETEETTKDGAKIKVNQENVSENMSIYQSAKKVVGEVAIKGLNKIVNTTKLAAKSLAKVLPDVKFVVVEDPEVYRQIVGNDSRATFQFDNKKIFINASKALTTTAMHEVGHAVLVSALKNAKKNIGGVTQRMLEALKKSGNLRRIKVTNPKTGKSMTLEEYLNDFAKNYSENLQSEEKIVETLGLLAANFTKLDIKEQGVIKRWLNKAMKALGLGRFVNEFTKTDRNIINFLNTFASKVSGGMEITSDDLTILEEIENEVSTDTKTVSKKKAPKKKAPKKKAAKKKRATKIKPKKPKVKTPKKGDQQESEIDKSNNRFQHDFSDPVSGFTFSYDVNSETFQKLEAARYITRDKSIKDFNNMSVLLHQPDGAYSGFIRDKQGNVLVEGKGGVFYTIKFHKDGSFWAGSQQAANAMVKLLNEAGQANGGKVLMALTSAPAEKLLSSTTMANGVVDLFNNMAENKTLKLGKKQTQNSIVRAANTELGTKLKLTNTFDTNLSKIKLKLGATEKSQDNFTSFATRKAFISNVIKNISEEINNSPEAINQFGKIFSEGIQNKYFKGKTKTGKLSISPANMTQALSEMLTEPVLKDEVVESGVDKGKKRTGEIYAILEIDGPVEAVRTDQHESYAFGIKAKNKGSLATVNLLTDRVKWSDVTIDPETSQTVEKTRYKQLYPSFGVSTSPVTLNTDNIQSVEDRYQMSGGLERLVRDYNVNERGFMPANIFNLSLLRRQARELGLGIQEAKYREGYRRGEISGYYFTRGFTKAGKPKFYNPRARYQFGDGPAVEQIVEARKSNISEGAIKLYLQNVLKLDKQQVVRALEDADFFADITTIEPSGYLMLGKKEGKALWNKIIDYVKGENIRNAKRNKLSDEEIGLKISEKREALQKKANFKSPDQIEQELSAYEQKLKKGKKKYSEAELNTKVEQRAIDIQQKEIDKKTKIDQAINRFEAKERKANLKREAKLTQAQIIDNAIQYLQIQPEYIDSKGKRKGKSDLQNLLIDQLLAGLSTRATTKVSQRMRKARERLEKKFGKSKVLTKKNVFYTQTQLINLIKQTIPSVIFETKQVQDLLKSVRDIAKPGVNINSIINDVSDQVNTINSKYLLREVENTLTKTYQVKKAGVTQAQGITNEIRTRIKNILQNTLLKENGKLTLEELREEITAQNVDLQNKLNELENEIAASPEERNALINEMVDLELAMKINQALSMEDSNVHKVETLSDVSTNLTQLVNEGTTKLKIIKQAAYQAAVDRASMAYEAITGEKLDMSDEKAVKAAKKKLDKAARAKETKSQRLFVLSRVYATLLNGIQYLKDGSKGIELLMENIDVLPGTLFGGTMQTLVYEEINRSSYAYKQMQIDDHKFLMEEAMNIFAPEGKGKLGGRYLLGRKKTAERALRKMNNKVVSGNFMNKFTFTESKVKGRVDADGNSIYINKAEVTRAEKKLNNAQTILEKRNAKIELNRVIDENLIIYSDAEAYYLYNMFKDVRNHSSFEAQFGGNYKILMSRIEQSLSPETKAWADWQTNVFYPSVYDRYNKVYNKLYHTDLPWNRFYSGRISYVDVENESVNLAANVDGVKKDKKKKDIKSVSMFSRTLNDHPIAIMNGNNVMSTYLTDMNWFAAYGEGMNNISKLFNNNIIKKAIQNKKGQNFYNVIKELLDRVGSRGIRTEQANKWINRINTFFITTRIALSPVIMMKQLLSMFTYIGDVGLINWFTSAAQVWGNTGTGGLSGQGIVGLTREIFKNSPYLKDRYSAGFQKTIESYGSSKQIKLLSNNFESLAMEFSLFFSKVGDVGAILLGGIPNYLYYKQQYKKARPNASEQEVIDYAIEKFQRNTKSTQQSSDIQDKDLWQTGDALARSFNMFKTTPKQYLRKSWYSHLQLARKLKAGVKAIFKGKNPITAMSEAGKGTFLENLRNMIMYQFVMPMTFQYVAIGMPGLLKPDIDDSDEQDMLRAAILGNLGGMFIMGDMLASIADALQGKLFAGDPKSIAPLEFVSLANKRFMAWDKAKEGTPEKEKAMLQFMAVITDLSGVPGTKLNQMRIHASKIDQGGISADEKLMRYLGYSEYVIKKAFGASGGLEGMTRKQRIIEENRKAKKARKSGKNTVRKSRKQRIIESNQ